MWTPNIENGKAYLAERTGKYEYRAIRYRAAIEAMYANGLTNSMSIVDVGAGATEFDYCLRVEYGWDGTYVPIDCAIDGTDLNYWVPPQRFDWFVAMEILEHLHNFGVVSDRLISYATQGVVISTPDPEHTDVLGMDETHVVDCLTEHNLQFMGYETTKEMFYGGLWSGGKTDSILGVHVK